MKTTERIKATDDEPLPSGGAYAIAYYRDEEGMPCPKSEATQATLIEYSERDRPIAVTLMEIPDNAD